MKCGSVEKQFTQIIKYFFIISLFLLVVSIKAGVAKTITSKVVPRQVNAKETPAQQLLKQAERVLSSKVDSSEERALTRKARALLQPLLTSNQPRAILAEAYYHLGHAARLDGDYEASRGYYLRAAALFPDVTRQVIARTESIYALRSRGDHAGAIAECRIILKEGKASRETQGNLHHLISTCLIKQDRLNEADWQLNILINMFKDTSWGREAVLLKQKLQDLILKQGKSIGPFTYGPGLAPPLAKAWVSLDRKAWKTEELHTVVGQQIWFRASTAQATDPLENAATLRDEDEDTVDGVSVNQWRNSIKCLWNFSQRMQPVINAVVNVDACVAKTFTAPGRYTVKLCTDDIYLGTAFDDLPVPAINELTIVVSSS